MNFFLKFFGTLAIQKKLQMIAIRRRWFEMDNGLRDGLTKGKTDRRIARYLIREFAPIFHKSDIGWALPGNSTIRNSGIVEYEFCFGLHHKGKGNNKYRAKFLLILTVL